MWISKTNWITWNHQSINQWNHQWTNQSIIQSINQSINQSIVASKFWRAFSATTGHRLWPSKPQAALIAQSPFPDGAHRECQAQILQAERDGWESDGKTHVECYVLWWKFKWRCSRGTCTVITIMKISILLSQFWTQGSGRNITLQYIAVILSWKKSFSPLRNEPLLICTWLFNPWFVHVHCTTTCGLYNFSVYELVNLEWIKLSMT